MDRHISTAFDKELNKLRDTILDMGHLIADKLQEAGKNISNPEDPQRSAKFEESINKLEVNLDEECVRLLALHRPAASDLRFIISAGRIVDDLESIADEMARLSKGLAKLIEKTQGGDDPMLGDIRKITLSLHELLNSVLQAYKDNDTRTAVNAVLQERDMEEQFQNAIRSRITMIIEEPSSVKSIVHCFWVLRSLERIGKCTRQIGNHVLYLVKGSDVRHKSRDYLHDEFLGNK